MESCLCVSNPSWPPFYFAASQTASFLCVYSCMPACSCPSLLVLFICFFFPSFLPLLLKKTTGCQRPWPFTVSPIYKGPFLMTPLHFYLLLSHISKNRHITSKDFPYEFKRITFSSVWNVKMDQCIKSLAAQDCLSSSSGLLQGWRSSWSFPLLSPHTS